MNLENREIYLSRRCEVLLANLKNDHAKGIDIATLVRLPTFETLRRHPERVFNVSIDQISVSSLGAFAFQVEKPKITKQCLVVVSDEHISLRYESQRGASMKCT